MRVGHMQKHKLEKGEKNYILNDKFLHKWHFSKFTLKLGSLETNHIIMCKFQSFGPILC